MAVAKGKWDRNTGYAYTCGQCAGRGMVHGQACSHCYALDYQAIMEAFKLARGERYYALLKAALSLKGKTIYDATRDGERLTIADIFRLMVDFDWPRKRAKPFFEWLEETNVIPSGTYRHLKDRGFVITTVCEKLNIPIE